MAKIKRISVNAFEKVVKETYAPTATFNWNGIEVTVKKTLSLKEMLSFVDSVVKSCFTSDTHAYLPEVKNFVTKVCVLEKYANFTMPSNVESQNALVYQTDAVECVMSYVNPQQYFEICSAIDDKVANIAQANIEAVNKQMTELYNSFDNLQTQLAGLFKGVSNDDIRAVAGALADGGLDEEKLVGAYIAQKSSTESDEVEAEAN